TNFVKGDFYKTPKKFIEPKNEDAAHRLVDDIESAILKRLENPLAFEPYRSAKRREYPYYRIYVRNYVVYYVVIGNVMEVRRLIYKST
ncbi:MAG: type II toxin-antitoxin system RelE/ParE family toxin, partial [Coprococcus comes]